MEVLKGLILIAFDGIKSIRIGFPRREGYIFTILMAASILGVFLIGWTYIHWVAGSIIAVVFGMVIAAIFMPFLNYAQGYFAIWALVIWVVISVSMAIYTTDTEADLKLLSTSKLTKQSYKGNSLYIKVKGEKFFVETEKSCNIGKEVRIYHRTKTMPVIGNCYTCEKYVGKCKEDYKREIIEIGE